jgi:hypothetical protein
MIAVAIANGRSGRRQLGERSTKRRPEVGGAECQQKPVRNIGRAEGALGEARDWREEAVVSANGLRHSQH